jgi:hypothetical protein
VGMFGINTSWDGWDEWVAAASEVVAIGAGLWGLYAEGWLARLSQRSGRQAQHRQAGPGLHHH